MEVEELKGKTLLSIDRDSDVLIFNCDNGDKYKMYHSQDCCECVTIEDINGDIEDLIGSPIILVEEVVSEEYTPEELVKIEQEKAKAKEEGRDYYNWDESFTWTFYKFATIKGYVTIRWHGSSNGYYSESVDFIKADENGNFRNY